MAGMTLGSNQTSGKVTVTDDRGFLVVEHPQYELRLDPRNGSGSFIRRPGGGGLLPGADGKTSLFQECFTQTEMEGKVPTLTFSTRIQKEGDSLATITLQTQLVQDVAGQDLAGAVLRRKMIFDNSKPYIEVQEELFNPTTDKTLYALLGIKNSFFLGNDSREATWMPTSKGVISINRRDGKALGYYAKQEWEYEATAGWLALGDSKQGLAFVFDYQSLDSFYNSHSKGNVGWFCDGGLLPPGQSFSTRYLALPTTGFTGVSHVNRDFVSHLDIRQNGNRLTIDNRLMGLKQHGPLTIETEVCGVRSHKTAKLPELKLAGLGLTPVVKHLVAPAFDEPVVVRVAIRGKNLDCRYETYAENGFRAQPIPFLQFNSEYYCEPPAKRPRQIANDAAVTPITAERRALLFFGMYTQWYKFDQILAGWKVGIFNVRPSKLEYLGEVDDGSKIPSVGMSVQNFKNSFFDYSLVVLSDAGLTALPRTIVIKLKAYLNAGGRLLVLGGPYAYGEGCYHENGFNDVLPVRSADFDLKWHRKGEIFRKAKEHPITRGLKLTGKPRTYWIHNLAPNSGAEIILTAGDACPLMVGGTYGKGKIICYTGTPLGEPARKRQLPFWQWDGWIPLMQNTLAWLTDGSAKTALKK
jgi:hypothetical protein